MMRTFYQRLLLLTVFALMLIGCQVNITPEQVADKFWEAAVNNNSVILKRLSSEKTYNQQTEFSLLHAVTAYELGKIVIDGNSAVVDTTLEFEDSNQPIRVKTYLVKETDAWLIDYERSVGFFNINRDMTELMGDLESLAEQFAEQVEGSVEEFRKKALPEIESRVEEAEKKLKEKLPQIKQKIQEFLEDLERSIEESMTDQEPKTTRT